MTERLGLRIATEADLPALAALRWRLKTDDEKDADDEEFARFEAAFLQLERTERASGEIVHWVAVLEGRVIAAMSVILVRKLASRELTAGRWGYLTNCYVEAEHRDAGVGGRLLDAIQSWARDSGLEFLIVWPSDRAFQFYQRAGFRRPDDVLLWEPA